MSDGAALPTIEDALALGLTRAEYELVCEKQGGRAPNRLELAMYSLLWSEHCAYKHSRRLLRTLPTEGEHVVMGPGENAGAVDVGNGLVCAFKVESHNHPSAVEPFQGAATGVGGILRDIFAIGARPIAVLDSLRFGEPAGGAARYLLEGAVSGIGHYGNSIGVPTVGGEVYFEAPYEQSCLVNAMALGLAPRERLIRGAAAGPGNVVVLFGASTGRDGIGGASVLASAELADEREGGQDRRPTVQVGDPFEEKKLLECSLELLERGLLVSLQDLGAAGLTSSASEMASKGGVGIDIDVDRVPLREPGMEPFEVMVSESQERMLCVVEPANVNAVMELCEKWEVNGTVIGTVTDTRRMRVLCAGELVGDMPVRALVDECPLYDLHPRKPAQPIYPAPAATLPSAGRRPRGAALGDAAGAPVLSQSGLARAAVRAVRLDRPVAHDPAPRAGGRGGARAPRRRRLGGEHRRQRPPCRGGPVLGDGGGGARVRGQPGVCRRGAPGHDQQPQLRQPGEGAHRLAADRGGARPRRRLRGSARADRGRQRVPVQRGRQRPDLPDAGDRHGGPAP